MRLSVNPIASDELDEAVGYYRAVARPGTVERFLKAVDETIDLLLAAPEQQTIIRAGVRRWRVRGFPYAIYDRVKGDVVRVLSYKHDSRRPGIWRGRE